MCLSSNGLICNLLPYGQIGDMTGNNHKNHDFTWRQISLATDIAGISANVDYTFYSRNLLQYTQTFDNCSILHYAQKKQKNFDSFQTLEIFHDHI